MSTKTDIEQLREELEEVYLEGAFYPNESKKLLPEYRQYIDEKLDSFLAAVGDYIEKLADEALPERKSEYMAKYGHKTTQAKYKGYNLALRESRQALKTMEQV